MRESRTRYNNGVVAPLLFKLCGAVVARRKMGVTRAYTGDRHLRIFRREYEKFIGTHVTVDLYALALLSAPSCIPRVPVNGCDAFLSQYKIRIFTLREQRLDNDILNARV